MPLNNILINHTNQNLQKTIIKTQKNHRKSKSNVRQKTARKKTHSYTASAKKYPTRRHYAVARCPPTKRERERENARPKASSLVVSVCAMCIYTATTP